MQRAQNTQEHYRQRYAGQLEEYELLMTRSVETLVLSEIDALLSRVQVVSQGLAQERTVGRNLIAHGKHVKEIIEKAADSG